ncbi:3-deoxy-D-arabinoheptulosonate-7-phosphate synthase [Nitrosospira multiformis]|uniref:3-deoxy-D-arabinoheptulosonate-7-phosphate synthase n=1 Tax=Nitrosospira multiformis TaxID=1231 RepID=A0A1H8NQW6_9PROT|nr:3-deoxy-7-phosphoheptulonate synthase [Nitrosospira multiformis]SEO31987.1 3-deoxy-D-arabinoheptulosonate-7-phosphate synthase [Nitrosospira multiformis]
MILVLSPDTGPESPDYKQLLAYLANMPGISTRVRTEVGSEQTLTEVYLIGNTKALLVEDMQNLPCVEQVVRISEEYRVLGRHKDDHRPTYFDYNGVRFGQDTLNVFAGLCAVDTLEHVELMMQALRDHGQVCTRMGAYKPRTSPYSFQGHGKACLPYVFELAGKYGIRVIAMEITHESHLEEICDALYRTGNATGVMLQIGTRNTQNFELLKIVGRQQDFPVLLKRGFGITLDESLNAAEYLASEGNRKVVFGLRGMKTNMGDPHRNFVDFAHVPVVKRLTRMPVCIDPSHSVGMRAASPDGILDIMHATAQGVIAGANMILVDFHPAPGKALVDGPQALLMRELPLFLEDVAIARKAYEQRVALAQRYQEDAEPALSSSVQSA